MPIRTGIGMSNDFESIWEVGAHLWWDRMNSNQHISPKHLRTIDKGNNKSSSNKYRTILQDRMDLFSWVQTVLFRFFEWFKYKLILSPLSHSRPRRQQVQDQTTPQMSVGIQEFLTKGRKTLQTTSDTSVKFATNI